MKRSEHKVVNYLIYYFYCATELLCCSKLFSMYLFVICLSVLNQVPQTILIKVK